MRRLTTNVLLQVAAFGFLSYWALWYALGALAEWLTLPISGSDIMIELSSALVLGAAPIVAYTWFSSAIQAVREGGREDYSFLNFSIFILVMAISYQRLWATATRWLDRPEWMLESALMPLAPWSIFFGLIMLLMTPNTTQGSIPAGNWWRVVAASIIGTALAFTTLGFYLGRISD